MSWSDEYFELANEEKKKKKKKKDSQAKKSTSFSEEFHQLMEDNRASDIDTARERVYSQYLDNKALLDSETAAGNIVDKDWNVWTDGYQFGDVTKTILGTAGDFAVNFTKGAGGLLEGAADFGLHVASAGASLFGNQDAAQSLNSAARFNVVDSLLDYENTSNVLDDYSIMNDTADNISQGVGQVSAIIAGGEVLKALGAGGSAISAITTGTLGASSFGSGINEAYDAGATDEEAWTYGLISGAADTLSEMMFAGFGKLAKGTGLGVSFLGDLDDMFAKKVSGMFRNQLAKNFIEYGIKATAEGVEEVVAGVAQAWGKSKTFEKEKNFWQILQDENLLEQFIVGSVTSGIMQSGDLIKSGKSRDFITGQTVNDQAVVKKEVENRIAEAEKDGETLTRKQKAEIQAAVERDLERGDISIDLIEEVLGGESYNSLKDARERDIAAIEELKQMYEGDELNQQIKNLLDNSDIGDIQQKLRKEAFEKSKDGFLANSYREEANRQKSFTADLSKYKDEKQRAIVQKAIDSGILNDRRTTHEFVDLVARISADKGIDFDFANNEKLRQSGFSVEGSTVNGVFDRTNKRIHLNMQSAKSLNTVVGHEITHVLEGTELYNELASAVEQYAKDKGVYYDRLKQTHYLYREAGDDYKGSKGFQNIKKELVADMVGDYIFSDQDFVNNLSKKHRNVFTKMYDEIKYLCKIVTAGSKEARQLEKVKKAFENAYRADSKASTDSDIKKQNSLSNEGDYAYHAGDLGKAEGYWNMTSSNRGTGHFGTGTYFVGDEMSINDGSYGKRPHEKVDFSNYKMFKPMSENEGFKLHSSLKYINDNIRYFPIASMSFDEAYEAKKLAANAESVLYWQDDATEAEKAKAKETLANLQERFESIGYDPENMDSEQLYEAIKDFRDDFRDATTSLAVTFAYRKDAGRLGHDEVEAKINSILQNIYNETSQIEDAYNARYEDSPSTRFMKAMGFEGIDVRGYKGLDNTAYGSVIYDLKGVDLARKKEIGTAKFSLSDNTGKKLSKGQQEYFKDSKVRDENGNLLLVHHGTPNANFTVFKSGTYFTEHKWYADRYQSQGASSLSYKKTADNPDTYSGYLNIKKPFDTRNKTERDIFYNEYYQQWGTGTDLMESGLPDWLDGQDLQEFLEEKGYDYDGLILDEGGTGGYGEEVTSRGISYVIFDPAQFKTADNKTPTADKDMRFSLSQTVEETDKLIAAHNLQSSELLKSFDLGGLPMPSIAITKANAVHDDYGDVTLILHKDAIDPKKSRYNKVYGGDAWTPTYPRIEYKPNEKVAKRIRDKYYGLAKEIGYDAVRPMYAYVNELEDTLNRYRGEAAMLENIYNDTGMMQVYLHDKGKGKVETIYKESRTELSDADVEMREFFINELGTDIVDSVMAKDGVNVALHKRQYWEKYGNQIKDAYTKLLSQEYGFTEEEVQNVLDNTKTYDYLKFVRDAYLYRKNGRETIKTEADRAATEEAIRKAAGEDYKAWVDNLFRGVEEKSGIRNNANYYTDSGNPRSWNALHWENTLENVVKVMRQQTEKGADTFFGGTGIWAVSSKDYRSIEEIKSDSHRLHKMSDEEYEAVKETYAQRFNNIAAKIADKSERNWFMAQDNAMEAVVDAVRNSKTKAGILNELKQYRNLNVTEAGVDEIVSLVSDIAEMPTGYFEAKPRRAVGFEEVGVFVIPRNADAKLKQELLNRGYSIAEYDPNVEGDRQKVVNQFEEYKFSLSKAGETPAEYGNYNVYGKDMMLDAPIRQDIAPVEEIEVFDDDTEAKAVDEIFPDDYAPMTEEETLRMQSETLDTLTDDDAPPVMDKFYDERTDSVTLDNKSLKQLSKGISDTLGLNRTARKELETVMQEFSQNEYATKESLAAEIERRFGTQYDEIRIDDVADAKAYIRQAKINVSPSVKSEFGGGKDYVSFMRHNMGKIRFSKEGAGVDQVYQELAELHPSLFPDDIINPADQLVRIAEVANTSASELIPTSLPADMLQDATDMIYDSIAEYKETERMSGAADMLGELNAHRAEFDAPIAETTERYEAIKPKAEKQPRMARATPEEQSKAESIPEERSTRKKLHEGIIEDARKQFADNGFDMDEVFRNAKNLSAFSTVDNTPQRVMEKTLGYKAGQVLSDITVNRVAQNETEGIKWLNRFTDRKNGVLAKLAKKYNIKIGSKEDAAAQMFAEGFYVNENDEIVKYGYEELAKDFPDAKTRENIMALAKDPIVREIYDSTLAAINESRTRNAYKEIPRLDNYFLHFRAMNDTFSRLGIPFNPNDIRAKDLPTDLNGVTADLKPGQPFFSSAMHRTGQRTSFSLLRGMEQYLTSAKNQIYHIDDIQTLRALRNYIADTYGQAHGLESLDLLSEEEAQDRIEKVYKSHLSNFAKFLNEEANVIAGKTTLIDRGLEGIIGRRGLTTLNTINQQVGSNMVGLNVSSSLTNLLPVVQTFAKSNKYDFVKGFSQLVANRVGSIFGRNDGFTEESPVFIRRQGAKRLYSTPWQKASDIGYSLMGAVDSVATELIARTKYNEYTRKGIDSKQAHYETDKWVSRLMGDRSLGQMPQLYNSKMLGLFTKFQLEVRNQLDSQFYDTVQEAKVSTEDIENGLKRNAKRAAKITATFAELAIAQHVFGVLFESIAGYNPAFDIVDALTKMFGWDDDEEDEDTVLDNLGEGFMALLEDLPYTSTLTGGRIPISSALPITEFINGKDQYGNEKSRLETLREAAPYYFLPTGYGQIKKTVNGLKMFDDDFPIAGSYTNSGNLRFPVEDTVGNKVQAALFGQWANENARDYFNNDWAPLQEKQIQEFIDLDIPIRDYREYREGLKGKDTLGEKAAYIHGLDLPIDKKNLLINNIADRDEEIDLTDMELYDDWGEFDYAKKYPEKHAFLEANGISYDEYENFDEDTKNAWSWAYQNPKKYTLSKAVSDNLITYRAYKSDLNDIEADKDADGDSISGSKKDKVADYINGLDIDYGQKIILYRSMYSSKEDKRNYNADIVEYLNSRDDISYDEMVAILEELDMTVHDDGTVTW